MSLRFSSCVMAFLMLFNGNSQSIGSYDELARVNPDSAILIFDQILDTARSTTLKELVSVQRIKALTYGGKTPFSIIKVKVDSMLLRTNNCKVTTDLLNLQAACFFYLNDMDSALISFNKLANYRPICDTANYSKAISNLAAVYTQQKKTDSAIFYFEKSIDLNSLLRDSLALASDYNNLGAAYNNLGLALQALSYLDSSILYGASHALLGRVYQNKALSFEKMYKPDQSLVFAKKAAKLFSDNNADKDLVNAFIIIGNQFQEKNTIDSANYYFEIAAELSDKIGYENGVQMAANNKANINFSLGEPEKSLKSLQIAYRYFIKIDRQDFAANSARLLSLCFAALSKYDSANYYSTQSKFHEQNVVQKRYVQNLADLNTKYQTAQKDRVIAEKNLEVKTKEAIIATQQNTIVLTGSSIVFLVLIGLIVYNRNKAKQKQALIAEKEKGFASVINATEEERNRISKDLHDGIGQQLSALKMALATVAKEVSEPKQKENIQGIIEKFSQSADDVRNISHQMMPRALTEQGLVPALEDLLFGSFEHTCTNYELEHSGISQRLPQLIEVSIYRIIQELISNIIKHSEASKVNVQLLKRNDKLLVFVEDNGRGFNPSLDEKGHGLVNIKSRVNLMKGAVNFEPSPESGTAVSLSIPLNHA